MVGRRHSHGFNLKLNYIMIRKTKKTRKYHAPNAKVTLLALEQNFCQTGRANIQVDRMEHLYHHEDGTADAEQLYFEF